MMDCRTALFGIALTVYAGVAAAKGAGDEAPPEIDLLEYLGSWQGPDEEWLIVADWEDEATDTGKPERKRNAKDEE